jgi:cellulase/cellobiase CelA1
VINQWGTGFIGEVIVSNPSATPLTGGWNVKWTFSGNQQISNLWNGVLLTPNGPNMSVNNAPWNGTIPANGSASFGFQASYSGTNSNPATLTCGRP